MNPRLRDALLVACLVAGSNLSTGCQNSPGTGSPVALREYSTRSLAADCYRNAEGFRVVHGGHIVWEACSRWARSVVKPAGMASR
jgi:hypothetical protein